MDLTRKVALVTGAEGGIGHGICAVLASKGASVIFAARKTPPTISSDDTGRPSVRLDVTSKDSIEEAVDLILKQYQGIDILVNNAGVIAAPGWEERKEPSDEDWAINYEVNLRGLVWVTEAVVPHMKRRQYGKIINISSGAARQGVGDHLPMAYGATKAGVINITQNYALALAPFNINVNAICPGLIWTPMWEKVGAHLSVSRESERGLSPKEIFDRQIKARIPLRRPQTPEDIGHAVAFFASDEAKNITGQTLNVNGGARMD